MWHYTQWPAGTCLVFIIKVVATSHGKKFSFYSRVVSLSVMILTTLGAYFTTLVFLDVPNPLHLGDKANTMVEPRENAMRGTYIVRTRED